MAGPLGTARYDPLAFSYPSPLLVLQYPLLAANIRILCEQDGPRARKQTSLAGMWLELRLTWAKEGLAGLYRGLDLYLLHQAVREGLRAVAGRCLTGTPGRPSICSAAGAGGSEGSPEGQEGKPKSAADRGGAPVPYWPRMATKYLIDAACYPLLLASARAVLLQADARSMGQWCRSWCETDGVVSLFGGLAASLASTALDEAADVLLEACVERFYAGCQVSSLDKLVLKACSSSVASVFTAPFNYVGVIQRCQSTSSGLPRPRPLWGTVLNLPWMSSLYQLAMFGGILALNVKRIELTLASEESPDGDASDE